MKAGRSVAVGKFLNAGQSCASPDYALVLRLRTDDFAQAVRDRADAMYPVIGGTPDYTSIISERHFVRLREMVEEAEAGGARVLHHHNPPDAAARQFAPTVLIDPPRGCRLMREEIFVPVLVVISVDSLDEAIAFVNDRPRPLALYAYTNDKATGSVSLPIRSPAASRSTGRCSMTCRSAGSGRAESAAIAGARGSCVSVTPAPCTGPDSSAGSRRSGRLTAGARAARSGR